MSSDREQAIDAVAKLAEQAADHVELIEDLAAGIVDVRRLSSHDSGPALRITTIVSTETALRLEQATGGKVIPT